MGTKAKGKRLKDKEGNGRSEIGDQKTESRIAINHR
jgi:hypothetical protein